MHRSYIRTSTKEVMNATAKYNEHGEMLDPNTCDVITQPVIGHGSGLEYFGFRDYGEKSGMTQKEFNDIQNNGSMLQWENRDSNGSHKYECKDSNATALSTSNYSYLENSNFQENTYINPPNNDGEPWTVSTESRETCVESEIGSFTPDLGEVTDESKAAIESSVQSYNSDSDELVETPTEFDSSTDIASWFEASNEETTDDYYDCDCDCNTDNDDDIETL